MKGRLQSEPKCAVNDDALEVSQRVAGELEEELGNYSESSIPLANDHLFAPFPLPSNGIDPKLGSVIFYLEDMEEATNQTPETLEALVSKIFMNISLKNLKKNMKNLKTKYGGTPQFIL